VEFFNCLKQKTPAMKEVPKTKKCQNLNKKEIMASCAFLKSLPLATDQKNHR